MNTQQFRAFFHLRTVTSMCLAALSLLIFAVACEDSDEDDYYDPELQPSTGCEPACGEGQGCFKDPLAIDGPPICEDLNCPPDNPTMACADDAICETESHEEPYCAFEFTCTPSCGSGTHCAGGNCIADYTSDNACDPLAECRNKCGGDPLCLQGCDTDVERSQECIDLTKDLDRCRRQNSCEPSATGCCSDYYCETFPELCSGETPCKACWDQCKEGSNPVDCLNNCAGNNPTCSTCLQPFMQECTDGAELSTQCQDLFEECTGSRP